ncbi:hypothetical protein AB0B88_08245 [Micromonospora haikouensis]|uniref:hypothetical protein n=1 Tax=Micromonospora haikouensis TaxID=686309 RepID=UPI0033DA5521
MGHAGRFPRENPEAGRFGPRSSAQSSAARSCIIASGSDGWRLQRRDVHVGAGKRLDDRLHRRYEVARSAEVVTFPTQDGPADIEGGLMPVMVFVHRRVGLHGEVHHLPEVADPGMRQGLLAADFLSEQRAAPGRRVGIALSMTCLAGMVVAMMIRIESSPIR